MLPSSLLLCLSALVFKVGNSVAVENGASEEELDGQSRYSIEGRVFPPDGVLLSPNWQSAVRLHINGGDNLGFVKEDGSFVIHNLSTGSYVLEVLSPEYAYESVRVEINSKGKFRARKVNHIQTNLVVQVPYPLRLKPLGRTRYFQMREQWRVTDFLFNPMVLMMVVPLVLIMILPKMLNDPETKKEMEQIGNLSKFEMPEMSDLVTNFLAGGSGQNPQQARKAVKSNKKNK